MKIHSLSAGAITLAILAMATPVRGQETIQSTPPDETTRIVSSIEKDGVKIPPSTFTPQASVSVLNNLRAALKNKGINASGWDEKKKRYVEVVDYDFPLDTLDMPLADFMRLRTLAFMGAVVKGNTGLCKALGESASLEIVLTTPGTPANKLFSDPLAKKKAELKALKQRAEDLGVRFEKAEKDALDGVTFGDRTAAAYDALIKKLDATHDPAKLQEQKDDKVAKLKAELAVAKKDADTLDKNLKDFHENYKKHSISSDFSAYFEHNIVGGTTLMAAEAVTKNAQGGYVLKVGIAFAWSPSLEKAARKVFNMGEEVVALPPGEKQIEDYLSDFDSLSFPPMFAYTDKEGSRWFLGTGYGDMSLDSEEGNDIASLTAYQNCYASLFLTTTGKQSLRLEAQKGNLGSVSSSNTAKTLASGFTGMRASGASPKFKADVDFPMQGGKTLPVRVYVVGTSAQSAVDAMRNEESLAESAALRFHHDTFMKGREDALKQHVENAKNNAADYQKGSENAKKGLPQQGNTAKSSTTANQNSPTSTDSSTPERPKIQEGQRVGPAVIPDDF